MRGPAHLSSAADGLASSRPVLPALHAALMPVTRSATIGELSWRPTSQAEASSPSGRNPPALRGRRPSGPPRRRSGAPPGPSPPPLAGRRRAGAHAAESVGVRRRERAVGADRPYLKRQRVQPRTVALHREARRKFSQWAAEQHLRQVSMDETDLAMTRYFDHMYFQGLSIVHARNAVHGAIFVKDYPRRSPTTMYRAKDALAGWFKAGPDRVRDPLPWGAAVLIADNLAERDREGVAVSGALLVSFDGCIRPSNTLAMTSREVSQRQAGSNPNYPSLVVTIAPQADDHGQQPAPSTKSGDHDCTIVFGDQASLKANRGICRDALLWASRKARRGRPPFDISLAKYEQLFNQAVSDVKLSSRRVTPHCARRGGPSTDAALRLRPLEAIQKRGL
ncbi:unnamed protein product [Prorocentrum cordatum]|uniref:Uncharacterized protein n=1 Tax=Prorocentrum cordatum TaxID=2364126 RepID=A0ABN9SES2_9DINO|nr:unnamed protein product [Polarella glacialis]